ncbi:hypothetical protein EB233_09690 [Mesorhizobium erdmanii]|uniref:DUF2569 domain-containing protein n=2 Tax=Mesorhizobium erdmanii TaxID=1777866 RepID=A0A6M7UEV1_9HYPH|nr:hypothetical protein A8146_20675 [Mesorhizobium loti]QKC75784.1 hypothetical protein EB233_09690 [Mesorhizobium erdmanii]
MMCTGKAARPGALDFAASRLSSEAEALRGHRPDMTSSSNQPGNGQAPAGRPGGDLFYVPVGWLIFVMAWSVYGLASSWWLFGNSSLPDRVFYFFIGGLVTNVITILWGLYLLGLAFGRSGRFPRHFTIWQIALIVWVLARQVYVLAVPDFVFSIRGVGIAAIEIGIGLLCIYLLRRGSGAEAVYARPQTEAPPLGVSILAALLGIVLGAIVGAVGGFLAGSLIADVAQVSCFEGGCGYFAAFFGLGGLVVGAIGGGILAVWLVHRRKRKPVT